MNIGIIEKIDFFEIGLLIKNIYEKKFKNEFMKFVTLSENEKIDVLVLDSIISEEILKKYFNKLKESSIIIVNIDDKELIKTVSKENYYIVPFGFNPKASITISSLKPGDKDTYTFCIQRDLETIKKNEIVEQEFLVSSNQFSEFNLLLLVSILLILDVKVNEINKFL